MREQLRREGWKILTVWQCQTKDTGRLQKTLMNFLGGLPLRSCE